MWQSVPIRNKRKKVRVLRFRFLARMFVLSGRCIVTTRWPIRPNFPQEVRSKSIQEVIHFL